MTASTTDRAVSTRPALAASTTMSSRTPATVSVASRSSTCPTRSVTDFEALRRKAGGRDGDDKAAWRQVGQQELPVGVGGRLARPTRSSTAVAVTFAPGTGRDCGSSTRPRKVAVAEVWATAAP